MNFRKWIPHFLPWRPRQTRVMDRRTPLNNPFDNPSFVKHYTEISEQEDGLQAGFERPTLLTLAHRYPIGQVLLAGGGPGLYAEKLLGMGHTPISLDISPAMTAAAQARLPSTAATLTHDVRLPLPFEAESLDHVISPLTLHYLDDWDAPFREFYRTLKPSGYFLFSVLHPLMQAAHAEHYFSTELLRTYYHDWSKEVFVFRRPLQAYFSPLLEAGFQIRQVLEPLPSENLYEQQPENAKRLAERPLFLVIEAQKPGGSAP